MGGGGSNTTSNNAYWNQQTQTYTPSAMIGGMGTQAGTMAQQAAMAPYQMPVSPVAGFTPMQEQGFQELQQQVGMAQPYFGTGASYLAASAAPVSGWDVAQYYNPMAGNVGAQMENIFGRQMQQATGQATQQAGGVGADRIGVAQGMLANQQGLAAGQTFANLYYPALQAAQQQKQMQAGAGYGIAQMGPAAQSAQLQSIQAQMAGGSQQQQLNQAIQNALYNWQVGQVAYPFQTANYLAGVTGGLAGPMGGTTAGQGSGYGAGTTTVNQPSNALGQGLGAGLSLMGMFGKGAGGRVPSYENGGATDYQPPEEQQANIGPRKGGYGDLRSMQMRRLLYPQFAEESLIGSPLAGQVYQTKAKALGTGMQFGGVPGAEYSQQHEGFAPVPGFQMASTVPIHNQPLQGLNTMQPFPKAPSGGGGGDQMAPISKGLKDLGAGVQKQRDQAGDEADDEFDRLSAQTTADPSTDPYATETYSQDTGDWGWEGDPMGGSAQGGGIQPGGPGPIMGGGIRAFRRGGEPEGPSFDPNLDVPNYRDIIDILGKDAPVRAQRAYLNEVAPRKWREPVAPGGQGLPHPQLPKGFPRGFNPDEDEIPGRSLSMNYREGGDTDFGDVDVANPHLDEDRAPLPRGAVYPELEAMKWLGRQASPDMPDIGPRSQPPSFTPPDQRGQIVGGGEQALPPTEFKGWGSAIRGIPAPEDMTSGLPPMDPGTTRRLISGFQRDPQTGEVITPTMDPFKGVAATDPYTAMLGSRPATAAGPRPDISFTDPMSGAIGPPGVTQAQAARPTPSDPLTGERLSSDPRGDPIRDPMGDFATGALAPGEQVPMPRGAAHPWERTSTPSLPGIVTDELVAGGLGNKHAIAGAMRTVSHESAWNPAMRYWDQPHHTGEAAYAHGLWSEGGDEWRRYTWWRANNAPDKPWDDPRTQAKFTAWNWKTNYPQMWAKLQNAKSPGEAAAIITHDYLKPSRENMNWRLAEYRRGAPSFESYFNQAGQTPDVGTRMAALTGTATDAHPEDPYAAGKPPSEATPRRATPVQYQSPIPTGDRYQRGPGPGPGAGADDRGLFGTGLFSRGWGERLQHDPVRMALIQAGAGMMGASSRPGSLGAAAAAGFGGFGTSIERGEAERRQELKSDRDYELKAQNLYDRLMQHQDTESRADRRLQFQERSQGERLQAQIQHQRETESHARLEGIAKNLREQGFTGDIGMEARKQDSMMFPLPAVPEKDRMEGFRYTDTAPGHVWHSQEWLDKTAADKAAADKKKKAGTGWFGWGTAAGEP